MTRMQDTIKVKKYSWSKSLSNHNFRNSNPSYKGPRSGNVQLLPNGNCACYTNTSPKWQLFEPPLTLASHIVMFIHSECPSQHFSICMLLYLHVSTLTNRPMGNHRAFESRLKSLIVWMCAPVSQSITA